MESALGCGLFLGPQLIRNENQTKVNTVLIGTKFREYKRSLITKMNKGAKIKKIKGSSFSGLSFRVLGFGSSFSGVSVFAKKILDIY